MYENDVWLSIFLYCFVLQIVSSFQITEQRLEMTNKEQERQAEADTSSTPTDELFVCEMVIRAFNYINTHGYKIR